ncbi:ROK family protein [Micromonospora sp. DT81.3]|uniref:ROK family protein n=1 Tax=Micromonospora sp. DT81.3 TaxID=3416523 RepID=UPI003CF89C40
MGTVYVGGSATPIRIGDRVRPAHRFEGRADAAVVVGIDAGRRHLTTAVADIGGTELTRQRTPFDDGHHSPDQRRAAAATAVDEALQAAGRARSDVLAICIGVPAPVDSAGASPPHRDGLWRRMNPDFAEFFAAWAPLVRVANDASLAAVAEGSVGAAIGCRDYVTLLAGERLGAGVVVDGHLLRGAHGGVADMVAFNHVIGVEGTWGLGYRARQWAREAVPAGEVAPGSSLTGSEPQNLDVRTVLLAARAGDPDAQRIAARVSATLGIVAGIFGSLFDPRRVIVSGPFSEEAAEVVAAARVALPHDLDLPAPELVTSQLGRHVVCIGAVAAALDLARNGVLDLTHSRRTAG